MFKMANKRVAILMSTYNGEEYLGEQIESIIKQSYRDWHLYIRDDGSKDRTIEIIEKYTRQDERITFFNKDHIENKGITRSFMDLLSHVDADFYMFSDQDDYWKEDKVLHSLNKMLDQDYQSEPICIHTDLQIVDADLHGNEVMNADNVWHDFPHLLFCNCVTGCTMMINQQLKNILHFDRINYSKIYLHDWWIALVAAAFGKVVYLNEATILYRQHGNNVVGKNEKNTLGHLLYRVTHQIPERKHMRRVVRISHELDVIYGKKLPDIDYRYVHYYGNLIYDGTPLHNLKLGIKLPPQRMTPKGKFFFTYLMMLYNNDLKNIAKE